MSLREERELDLNNLRNKRDDLEEQMRHVKQIQEEEEYNIIYGQRKMEQMWDEYGKYAPELASVLEEENAYIESFKSKYEEYSEQIKKEYNREMENIDSEVNKLQTEVYSFIDEGEEAEGDIQYEG